MKSYRVEEFNGPLVEHEGPVPEPQGTEVLVRVTRAGVCHSDLHIWEGFYEFGGGNKMSLADRGLSPPITMGHEIFGEIVKGGPDAGDLPIGAPRLVYPWLGCGDCPTCKADRENHCATSRSLGVFQPGGYAEYCLVPHPKHLIDIGDMDPSVATPHACSGVTVYSALRKAQPIEEGEWLVIMGAGGLGLNAVAIASALGMTKILSCDIDDQKLAAARAYVVVGCFVVG
ncbi:MAG: alcohol dehydrogenase catalytic domain-containing protein, partial [Thalassobaculaceae bacterium]